MTKGLHKDSLRKGEPNKWIAEDIIERIRAEVNRQRTFYNLNNPYDKRAIRVCNNILSTLGNLEKECEDFPTTDEEMAKFLATHPKVELPEKYKTPDWMFEKSEKPSEGLEEEIKRFQKEVWDYDTTLSDVARHFAKWGAEHAKKNK